MGQVRFKNWGQVGRWYRRLTLRTQGALFDVVEANMDWATGRWQERMISRVSSPAGKFTGRALPPGAPPGVRSGTLRRSFGRKLEGNRPNLASLRGLMFSTAGVVAVAQEYGTKGAPGNSSSPIPTIRPKRGKYLTIPMPAALTPSGRPKGGRRFARDWPDLFFHVSERTGQPFLAQRDGDDLRMIYMLKRSVDLRPRLGMRMTFGRVAEQFVRRVDVDTAGALNRALGRR